MRVRPALFILSAMLLACGGPHKTSSEPVGGAYPCGDGNPCAATATAEGDPTADFAGWESWTKINGARFFSKAHGEAWVDVYVEPTYAGAYREGRGVAGMRIVKAQYASAEATEVQGLTAMQKREPGYDDANGDWFYGVYAPDGTTAKTSGKLAPCINCHTSSDTDYLFSSEVMSK